MTIARLRLVFAALALALAIPGALLVQRALASVALEHEARERAVAERAFDQMERTLTELLRREEARPVSDYDFASAASPLRARPEDSLALGWFQIEADGRVAAPAWAERAAALGAEIAGDGARFEALASPAAAAPVAPRREGTLEDSAKAGATRPDLRATKPEALARAPGVADVPPPVMKPEPAIGEPMAPSAAPEKSADLAADAYDALAKLNTGAKEREQRKQRVYVEEQAVAPESAPARAQASASLGSTAGAESPSRAAGDSLASSEQLVARAMAAPPSASEWSELASESDDADSARSESDSRREPPGEAAPGKEELAQDAEAQRAKPDSQAARERSPLPPEAKRATSGPRPETAGARAPLAAVRDEARPGSELVRVVVDPMRGRLAQSGELLLVRSAWIGDRGVRQGVALDVAALERTLASAALGDGALPGARARLSPAAQLASPASTAELRAFAHRFAEPFDALATELSFAPFPDAGARSVYWLAGLFALAGAGGLLAVYRMTAVALHFAERRSNFAAAVSHELKTPLTAIRLYAEMLRDGLVSGEQKRREYYGSIAAETERLSRLINNVLEFSRLERGARSLEIVVGDVAPVVREAVDLLRPHAAKHGLALELAIDERLPPVRFERDALLQILFNLVDNAVKYGRGELATIGVTCRRLEDGVAVAVRDHGPGVPREELARILEAFYRRGDELTRSAPGAGIGLALVRSLVQQMGARLRLANCEGGGLAVTVQLSGSGAA